jgi:WD40 repeat protein
VEDVAFSTNAMFFAAAFLDGAALVWDNLTGILLQNIEANASRVVFSPNQPELVTISKDGFHVKMWRTDCHKPIRTFSRTETDNFWEDEVKIMAFDYSGKRLALVDMSGICTVWNVDTAQNMVFSHGQVYEDSDDNITSIEWMPDSTNMLTLGDWDEVCMWDTETGRHLWKLDSLPVPWALQPQRVLAACCGHSIDGARTVNLVMSNGCAMQLCVGTGRCLKEWRAFQVGFEGPAICGLFTCSEWL